MLMRAMAMMGLVLGLLVPAVVLGDSAGEEDAVRAQNAEFYRAFREADRAGMEAVWGHQEPISVEHPSGWRAEGRIHVMNTWWNIFEFPPNIRCEVQSVVFAVDRASVRCLELLDTGTILMINVFHKEDGVWKMIYHGPVRNEATS